MVLAAVTLLDMVVLLLFHGAAVVLTLLCTGELVLIGYRFPRKTVSQVRILCFEET